MADFRDVSAVRVNHRDNSRPPKSRIFRVFLYGHFVWLTLFAVIFSTRSFRKMAELATVVPAGCVERK